MRLGIRLQSSLQSLPKPGMLSIPPGAKSPPVQVPDTHVVLKPSMVTDHHNTPFSEIAVHKKLQRVPFATHPALFLLQTIMLVKVCTKIQVLIAKIYNH